MAAPSVSYVRAALAHPANVLLLAAGAVVAALFRSEVPLLLVGGLELAYLGVVPGSARFRRAIDAQLADEERRAEQRRVESLLEELAGNQREHYLRLQELTDQIKRNYRRLQSSHGPVLMEQSVAKLDSLLAGFLKLLVTLNDYRRYLNATDRRVIERELSDLQSDLAGEGGSDAVRDIKRKRVEILQKRLERFVKSEETREVISHQLASIEDVMRLVHEQSITIRDPQAITAQLDALTIDVEETENTVKEMEHFLTLAAETHALPVPPQPVKVR